MRVLAVDDRPVPRRALARAIQEAAPDIELSVCANAKEVLAVENLADYDAAFIDIDMPGENGISLARKLKQIKPDMNIVFATGYSSYMPDAFELHSSGYLLKPITAEKVKNELANLRYPHQEQRVEQGLRVQCFGNFEVFVDGEPVHFSRSKTKELLAFLVDRRGAACSIDSIEVLFWEDGTGKSSRRSYIRTLIADLRKTLEAAGYGDCIVKRKGYVSVRPQMLVCDYYAYLEGDPTAVNAYRGEYMSQYSWAEATLASLTP